MTSPSENSGASQETVPHVESSHAQFRGQRIKRAIVTSVASKVISLVVQLLALPLAAKALGVERFGIYAMLASSLSWIMFAGIGAGPGLMRGISKSVANSDRESEKKYFASIFFIDLLVGVLFATLLSLSLLVFPAYSWFGAQYAPFNSEIALGVQIMGVLMLLQLMLGGIEVTQSGYQSQHVFNGWMIVGNSLSAVALVIVALKQPTINGLILSVYGAPIIARSANALILLFVTRPYLKPKLSNFDFPIVKEVFSSSAAFTFVQISNFICHQFTVVQVGRILNAQSAAKFAIMMQFVVLSLSVVSMLSQPLWPALMDAVARREFGWVQVGYRKTMIASLACATTASLFISLLGNQVVTLLYGAALAPGTGLQICIGLYFFLLVNESVNYIMITALHIVWLPSLLIFARTIVAVGVGFLLLRTHGNIGLAGAMFASAVLSTTWIFPLIIRRTIKEQKDADALLNRCDDCRSDLPAFKADAS